MKLSSKPAILFTIVLSVALVLICILMQSTRRAKDESLSTSPESHLPDSPGETQTSSVPPSGLLPLLNGDSIPIDRKTKHQSREEKSSPADAGSQVSLSQVAPSVRRKAWRPPSQQTNTLPASFMLTDNQSDLPPGAEEFLNELAMDFKVKMEESGLSPDDPEYKALWEQESWLNEIRFKTTYGDAFWLQYHEQAMEQSGQ
jgi:hypothetical protein